MLLRERERRSTWKDGWRKRHPSDPKTAFTETSGQPIDDDDDDDDAINCLS